MSTGTGDADDPCQPIGPLLDVLGVTTDLAVNQQITEVLVLAKVVDFESGTPALGVYHSGIDWMAQLGLIDAARMVIQAAPFNGPDDID